jgi:hypothetical protein
MDRQLGKRRRSKTICAVAFASFVCLPTSIYEEAPIQDYAPTLSTSIVAASPSDDTPSDKTPLDLPGEDAAKPFAASPNEKAKPVEAEDAKSIASEIAPSIRNDDVNLYLWSVYERSILKIDEHGDFTWKDAAAAARMGLPIEEYVIGGMDPDFRELLFAAGHALDAAGINWTILSAFRDDYRQGLAVGLKARFDNSFHGGSASTGGYGHGCAVDVASTDRLSDNTVWNWLDKHGEQFGLHRPLRAIDPAHVLPRPGWRELASIFRSQRISIHSEHVSENNDGGDLLEPIPPASTDNSSFAGLSEEQFLCVRPRIVYEPNPKPAPVHRLNSLVANRFTATAQRKSPKAKRIIGSGTPSHGAAEAHGPAIHPHGKAAATRHVAGFRFVPIGGPLAGCVRCSHARWLRQCQAAGRSLLVETVIAGRAAEQHPSAIFL